MAIFVNSKSIVNENSVRYKIRTFLILLTTLIVFVELGFLSDVTKLIHFYVISRGYDDGSELPKIVGILLNLNILMALIIQIKIEISSIKMKDPNGKIARLSKFFKRSKVSDVSDNESIISVKDKISVSIVRLIMILSICSVILVFLTGPVIVMSVFEIISIIFFEVTLWSLVPFLYIFSIENLKKYSFKKMRNMFKI